MNNCSRQLGTILVNHSVVSEGQIDRAIDHASKHGCRLGEALIALDLCSEVDIARALAEQNDVPFVDLQQTPPTREALKLISRDVAVEYGIVPVRIDGPRLLIAARDPYDIHIDDVVKKEAEMGVLVASCAEGQLRDILSRYEDLKWGRISNGGSAVPGGRAASPMNRVAAPTGARVSVPIVNRLTHPAKKIRPEILAASEHPPLVQKVNSLIADAVRRGVSDLQFEPADDGLRVRCRIDGYLHPLTTVPRQLMEPVVVRLRLMCGINPNLTSDSATGGCDVRVDGRAVRLNATLMPEADKDLLLFRVIYPDPHVPPLDQLGMTPEMLRELRSILVSRQGMVLVTGPMGSGKPTTLYSLLKHLQEAGTNVFALEDTFERKLTGIHQVQVGDRTLNTFSSALELALNQKPQAVMVGELPDKASAEVACRAAATGQMVLAGSHSPDALTAISRLFNTGVAPQQVGPCLRAVLSQRLVRRVCENCAKDSRLPWHLQKALAGTLGIPEGARFRKGKGCPECYSIGSRGCIGVFELILIDDDLREVLSQRVPPSIVQEHLAARGFTSLEEDAFRKVCQGLVAPEELQRLGLRVATAMDELAALNATEDCDTAEADATAMIAAAEEEPLELDTWEEVADMAKLLGDVGDLGAGSGEGDNPENWGGAADLALDLN
jgi:type IV pilus assembly protein PilB